MKLPFDKDSRDLIVIIVATYKYLISSGYKPEEIRLKKDIMTGKSEYFQKKYPQDTLSLIGMNDKLKYTALTIRIDYELVKKGIVEIELYTQKGSWVNCELGDFENRSFLPEYTGYETLCNLEL